MRGVLPETEPVGGVFLWHVPPPIQPSHKTLGFIDSPSRGEWISAHPQNGQDTFRLSLCSSKRRADTQVRPYGIQINIPKIHTPPCAIVSLKTSHPILETEALPLLRRRRRGRRRLHDRAFSGSARGRVLFSNHGLLLIPWKLFALKTLPSRLRRQAPTCRRHPPRECARHHQAILLPQSRNVLHPDDSATP